MTNEEPIEQEATAANLTKVRDALRLSREENQRLRVLLREVLAQSLWSQPCRNRLMDRIKAELEGGAK